MNIPITRPTFGKEEINAVAEIISSGNIVKGKRTEEVEKFLKKKFERKYSLFLTSGTASLNAALTVLGIGLGDEVITTPFTFIASATAIVYVGAKVVFADIDPKTYNIDPKEVEKKITRKTKAILAVDLFGYSFDYYELRKVAKKYSLYLIEDAAQAHGAFYKGRPAGSLGDISIFSFYGTKVVTSGEGGAILTNNKIFYEKAKAYRGHGEDGNRKYYFTSLGYNFMPTDIQAAILLVQLKKLSQFFRLRNNVAKYYTKKLSKIKGITTPVVKKGYKHAFCCYTVRIDPNLGKRDEILVKLKSAGIGARVYYPYPVHLQPFWKKLGYNFKKGEYPEAERASQEVLSLPIYTAIKRHDLDFIIDTIKSIYKEQIA